MWLQSNVTRKRVRMGDSDKELVVVWNDYIADYEWKLMAKGGNPDIPGSPYGDEAWAKEIAKHYGMKIPPMPEV